MKNDTSKPGLGYVAILLAMLCWGMSFIWSKQLLNNNFPGFTIVFIRLSLASAVFVSIFKWQKKLEKIRREDRRTFLLLAFFEPFLYFIGETFALKYVDASFAAVIIALIPIVVSVTMYFTEKEKLRWEFFLGTLISVIGVFLLSLTEDGRMSFNLKGLLLLCVAMLAASGYSVMLSRLLKKYSPITVTTYQNLIAIPFYLPFVLIFDLRHWGELAWNGSTITSLVCLALLCSAGAYMLYSYSVKQLTVTKACIFTNLIPIVTLLVASAIGQETFTQVKFWGILVIIAGVTLSQMKLGDKLKMSK
ncbi:MAG: EamA family transporter [Bacteroidales bacterium]|nr:EamA family transporter [Bacteroidales bacterium]